MDTDGPLFLTPLIATGQLDKARSLSEIPYFKIEGNVTSYSGYFTINSHFRSNLFFWFFPCINRPEDAPLILWLQGGPGQPSTIGLFEENGPLRVTDGRDLHFRNLTWTRSFNMLYIDSPVGTGCSFVMDDKGYAETQKDISKGLYEALTQFFKLFPEYGRNEFYIAGESYEGKYAPNLAMEIHLRNVSPYLRKDGEKKINLKGLAIGNGFIDPLTQIENDAILYNTGLFDENDQLSYKKQLRVVIDLIGERNYFAASVALEELMYGNDSYATMTGLHQYYHLLRTTDPPYRQYLDYLNSSAVRRIIHVGNATCHTDPMVTHHLLADLVQSAKPAFEFVLERGYKVLLYSGNLDIIVGTATTVNFLRSLRSWTGADRFRKLPKIIWRGADGDVDGYVKKLDNFVFVVVRNAGHMAIADQPEVCYDMMLRFVFDKPFD